MCSYNDDVMVSYDLKTDSTPVYKIYGRVVNRDGNNI